jgi:small subunit ribosomal protein S21
MPDLVIEVVWTSGGLEKAMRKLKRKLATEGVLREIKKRRYYEKPSQRRKRKMRDAQRRRRRKVF